MTDDQALPETKPLSDLRILVHDESESQHYGYAKVDLVDGGNAVMVFDHATCKRLTVRVLLASLSRRCLPGRGRSMARVTTLTGSMQRRRVA